jgi:hypothetical protein
MNVLSIKFLSFFFAFIICDKEKHNLIMNSHISGKEIVAFC